MLETYDTTEHTVYRIFDSVEDLLTAVKTVPTNRISQHSHLQEQRWVGRTFREWEAVYTAARQPWGEGIETLERMLDDLDDVTLPKPKSRRRRTRFSEDNGDEVDYDRLRSGQPFWRTSRREETRGPSVVTVVVDLASSAGVSHKDILWRGAAGIALTKRLEEAGYRVELWASIRSNCLWADRDQPSKAYNGYNTHALHGICLKRASDPLDESTLISAVSGWFYRTIIFRAHCLGQFPIKESLGRPLPPTDHDLDQISRDPKRIVIDRAFTYGEALGLVREQLTEMTTG